MESKRKIKRMDKCEGLLPLEDQPGRKLPVEIFARKRLLPSFKKDGLLPLDR